MADISLNNSINITDLIEFGRDYCSDHLGRFFQNKYSMAPQRVNQFKIPVELAKINEQDALAICVMMNNHILDIKYFSDIFPDWNKLTDEAEATSGKKLDLINAFINDQRLLPIIKSFKKINDEIVIGRCSGLEFTTLI